MKFVALAPKLLRNAITSTANLIYETRERTLGKVVARICT
jgi:hypothetical protein